MKLLTHQSDTHDDRPDSPPFEMPQPETEQPEEAHIPEHVQMLVRLEGTSCIRLDSLGGGKIQLAFSDEQANQAFELGKYRGKNLIATFLIKADGKNL